MDHDKLQLRHTEALAGEQCVMECCGNPFAEIDGFIREQIATIRLHTKPPTSISQ